MKPFDRWVTAGGKLAQCAQYELGILGDFGPGSGDDLFHQQPWWPLEIPGRAARWASKSGPRADTQAAIRGGTGPAGGAVWRGYRALRDLFEYGEP